MVFFILVVVRFVLVVVRLPHYPFVGLKGNQKESRKIHFGGFNLQKTHPHDQATKVLDPLETHAEGVGLIRDFVYVVDMENRAT